MSVVGEKTDDPSLHAQVSFGPDSDIGTSSLG
jgi:hypothetical protein